MKPPPFEYHRASSIDEAVALLAEHGDEAKVLAGGQSLVPLLSLRLARPGHLVDVNRVDDLDGIANGSGLTFGALTRHRAVERSPEVAAENPLLAAAVRHIGHAAIRNRGTIGGSVAHADPSAELPAVLLALGGDVEARSSRGTRRVAAADLFEGFLTTTLEPDELLTSVRFPAWQAGTGWSFLEFSRRSGDFAIVGVAALLRGNQARLTFSGVDTRPIAVDVEVTPDTFADAAREAVADFEPASDIHGTADYRKHLAATLATRALQEAHERAGDAR